jgi:hypothetical protein
MTYDVAPAREHYTAHLTVATRTARALAVLRRRATVPLSSQSTAELREVLRWLRAARLDIDQSERSFVTLPESPALLELARDALVEAVTVLRGPISTTEMYECLLQLQSQLVNFMRRPSMTDVRYLESVLTRVYEDCLK